MMKKDARPISVGGCSGDQGARYRGPQPVVIEGKAVSNPDNTAALLVSSDGAFAKTKT